MKAKIKESHTTKHQQDSKIMQLSDFPQLSDQELELLLGGWASSTAATQNTKVSGIANNNQ